MNKKDFTLIGIILSLSLILLGIYNINNKKVETNALVYYENELLLKIDLTTDEQTYKVKGYNGPVFIKAGNGKIMIDEENSPKHLCSKQGYISKPSESIICLPNKIIVKIEAKDDNIDTIIK